MIRKEKSKTRLKAIGTVAGVAVAVVVGAAIVTAQSPDEESSSDVFSLPLCEDDDYYPICDMCGEQMTEYDGVAW